MAVPLHNCGNRRPIFCVLQIKHIQAWIKHNRVTTVIHAKPMLTRNGSCCCRLKVSNSRNNDRGDNISHMRIPIIINRKRRIWAVMIMSGVD